MTRISVAIATYNGARYLPEQLQSLAAQTLSPCEVVVCDDGSTDATLQVIDDFARSAPFAVRAVRNEARLNYRANFMQAAQRCSGDLIAFCDQDDVWRADKLAVTAAPFADPEVLLVHHNARIYSAQAGVTGQLYRSRWPPSVSEPLRRNPFALPPGFTQVFRRSLLTLSELRAGTLDYWGPGESLAHDQWVYILASSLGRVAYEHQTLVDYRQHEHNLYGVRRTPWTRWDALKARVTRLSDYGYLETAFESIAGAFDAARAYPLGEPMQQRAAAAARHYRQLSQAYGDRYQAHGAATLRARAAAWKRLWRSGRYRAGCSFHFAGHAAARDALHGVCLGRLRHPPPGLPVFDPSLTLAPTA
jgi:glycosyltransferase involved in cell wall biosynthesis